MLVNIIVITKCFNDSVWMSSFYMPYIVKNYADIELLWLKVWRAVLKKLSRVPGAWNFCRVVPPSAARHGYIPERGRLEDYSSFHNWQCGLYTLCTSDPKTCFSLALSQYLASHKVKPFGQLLNHYCLHFFLQSLAFVSRRENIIILHTVINMQGV